MVHVLLVCQSSSFLVPVVVNKSVEQFYEQTLGVPMLVKDCLLFMIGGVAGVAGNVLPTEIIGGNIIFLRFGEGGWTPKKY